MTKPSKKNNILYWIFTGLLAVGMLMSAIPDIFSTPDAVAVFNQLGYPAYLLPFLGIAKTLGVAAILVPGFPRLKEWAYAGLFFDLTGAGYSSLAAGNPVAYVWPVLLGYVLIAGSYIFYHRRRRAVDLAPAYYHTSTAPPSTITQLPVG